MLVEAAVSDDEERGIVFSVLCRTHVAGRVPERAVAVFGVGALAHALPSALILPTFFRRPPERWGTWCRWSARSPDRVAITFDDGPDVHTLRTLDLLDRLDLRATFFVLGCQLQSHPGIVKEIVARGHEVGTHGYAHRHHLLSTPGAIWRDMDRAIALHHQVLDTTPRYFRPPFGQLTLPSVLAARHHRLETVLWSAWGKEWSESDPSAVLRRLEGALRPGAIVLLHDNDVSCPAGTGERTREVLPLLATQLRSRGLRAATLSKLLEDPQRRDGRGDTAA